MDEGLKKALEEAKKNLEASEREVAKKKELAGLGVLERAEIEDKLSNKREVWRSSKEEEEMRMAPVLPIGVLLPGESELIDAYFRDDIHGDNLNAHEVEKMDKNYKDRTKMPEGYAVDKKGRAVLDEMEK